MRLELTNITQILLHYFKSFTREKSTKDAKVLFYQGNELKLTQVYLFSFLYFNSMITLQIVMLLSMNVFYFVY